LRAQAWVSRLLPLSLLAQAPAWLLLLLSLLGQAWVSRLLLLSLLGQACAWRLLPLPLLAQARIWPVLPLPLVVQSPLRSLDCRRHRSSRRRWCRYSLAAYSLSFEGLQAGQAGRLVGLTPLKAR
jgi:hypothetical protein